MVRYPEALWRFAIAVKHINRDTAAWIPIATNAEPFRANLFDEALPDTCCASFMEVAVIAERPKEKLKGLTFDNPLIRAIINNKMGKVRLTCDGANACKLWRNKTHHIVFIARVLHALKFRLIRRTGKPFHFPKLIKFVVTCFGHVRGLAANRFRRKS